ncbi:MAG: lysophospholipid acyltransferase family protein, partial [Proteobacteria bacterium]|nr:lysophospholipid acyltransferase family protein [Pseudomonadota bacterium]
MLKFLLGNPVFQFVVGRLIGFYMLFVGATTRWRKVNPAAMERFFTSKDKHLACIWHGRFTLVHKLWRFGPGAKPAKFLISRSREGGLVAWVSRTVGAEVVRGSAAKRGQQKGGVEALREMARHLDGGGVMGMTPDGPRGPRMRAKRGPVQLAKIAGASLAPIAWSTSNRIVFDSWDKFILPLPFGRGALIWGDAIPVPPDADAAQMEAIRIKL